VFARLKTLLRKAAARTLDAVSDAVSDTIANILAAYSPTECAKVPSQSVLELA